MLSQIDNIGIEEIVFSNFYVQRALINLLTKKGILTESEILKEVKDHLNSSNLEEVKN